MIDKLNVFIDTNVWLSIYNMSNNDLNEFEKLKDLINSRINLFIPKQVYDEFYRNRDTKINEALTSFKLNNIIYPNVVKPYDGYQELRAKERELQGIFRELETNVKHDISNNNTQVDQFMSEIFSLVNLIDVSEEHINNAVKRYNIGNPPGKDRKYGDAINWEVLLSEVPDGQDLYFVANDNDYFSILDKNKFNLFLSREWSSRKNSEIKPYRNLKDFTDNILPEIQLRGENEKNALIDELEYSPNFFSTHLTIAKLASHSDWTDEQVEKLCSIIFENNQVGSIMLDEDIADFYQRLLLDENEKLVSKYDSIENIQAITQTLLLGDYKPYYQVIFPSISSVNDGDVL